MRINFRRYALYLLRWQASTPILAGVTILLAGMGYIEAAFIANLIGGLIFFWVDPFIFTSQSLATQWDVRERYQLRGLRQGSHGGTGGSGPGIMTRVMILSPSSGVRGTRKRGQRCSGVRG